MAIALAEMGASVKKAITIIASASLVCACVQLPDILETEPVSTASFTGSHLDMAQCVRSSLPGGKVQRSPDGSKIDIYDSKKAWSGFGVTHYAVSVYKDGTLELRKLPEGKFTQDGRERLWLPIENCIKVTSAAKSGEESATSYEVATVAVPANKELWVESGVAVIEGKTYRFAASGSWTVNIERCGWSGPDGGSGPCSTARSFPQAVAGSYSALIAKIGDGPAFLIGSGIDLTADRTGALLFRINDSPGGFDNNEGEVTVRITSISSL